MKVMPMAPSPRSTTNLEPWIETYTGKHFYFLDPKEDDIDIRDIAHALAFTCRYTGHSNRFYSVAEHSVLVSYLANDPLAALLHDASEAYITDIASPIKQHLGGYAEMEDRIMEKIARKFGFSYPLDPDIKDCDATQLKTEAKHLLRSKGATWAHLYPTKRLHGIGPNCWTPQIAEQRFLERFDEVRKDFNEPPYADRELFADKQTPHYRKPDPRLYGFCVPQGAQLDGGQLRKEDCGGQSNYVDKNSRSPKTRREGCPSSRCDSEETVGNGS